MSAPAISFGAAVDKLKMKYALDGVRLRFAVNHWLDAKDKRIACDRMRGRKYTTRVIPLVNAQMEALENLERVAREVREG